MKGELEQLKKEKNAVVLAHYYVADEVQQIADYIGDSFYLSKAAEDIDADTLVFAGVRFMGESAKILNPRKTVLLPATDADCPMAHMASVQDIEDMRGKYDDLAVVCYVNSTAEIKAHSDVCVTSANAVNIVRRLKQRHIFFVPDKNLAHYVSTQVPEKHIMWNEGYCPYHNGVDPDFVKVCREKYKEALVLAHPECRDSVLALADYVGSTAGIIDYIGKSEAGEFIIATEDGVMCELKKRYPDKMFYSAMEGKVCADMKKITCEGVYNCLRDGSGEVQIPERIRERAALPLKRMLELAR